MFRDSKSAGAVKSLGFGAGAGAARTGAAHDADLGACGDADGEALQHQRQARAVPHAHVLELDLQASQRRRPCQCGPPEALCRCGLPLGRPRRRSLWLAFKPGLQIGLSTESNVLRSAERFAPDRRRCSETLGQML